MRLALALLALVSLPASAATAQVLNQADTTDLHMTPDSSQAPTATDPADVHPDDDLVKDDAALDVLPPVRFEEDGGPQDQTQDTTPPARSPAGDIQLN